MAVFAFPLDGPFAASLDKELAAAGLQALQAERAVLAAEEAELILQLAALCPVEDDPPPEHPGARRRGWSPHEEQPDVSEFFLDELAMVLNVGRGTAAFRARRAFCWRDRLPATFAALKGGELDERRAQELFTVLEHVEESLARRIDAALIGQAAELSVAAPGRRARELLLDWDAAADERRRQVAAGADVFCQDKGDGLATLGADLPVEQAAEAYQLINQLAVLAKQDGDERPIHQIRVEIYSLLLRYPGLLGGTSAHLTITATLDTLDGRTTTPAQLGGYLISPAQLADLPHRVQAIGLHTPPGGTCTLGLLDEHGRLLATTTPEQLANKVARGEGLNPPPRDRRLPAHRRPARLRHHPRPRLPLPELRPARRPGRPRPRRPARLRRRDHLHQPACAAPTTG